MVNDRAGDDLPECAARSAYSYEQRIGSCPQCVLVALMDTFGIGDKLTIKAVDALAGGTALSTEGTCGALIGGMLAIGFLAGRTYEDFLKGKKKRRVFTPAQKLYDRFISTYYSPVCKHVQVAIMGRSFDLRSGKDYLAFKQSGGDTDKCPLVAANVARWTSEIIIEDLQDM